MKGSTLQMIPPYDLRTSGAKIETDNQIKLEQEVFEQLEFWLTQTKKKIRKNVKFQETQISQIQEYIQITEGIQMSRRTKFDKVFLKCKRCPYSIEFEECCEKLSKNSKREAIKYCIRNLGNKHNSTQNDDCYLHQSKVYFLRVRKYLKLITPILESVITENINQEDLTPTKILPILSTKLRKPEQFLFKGLEQKERRKLKKHFDNMVASIKNQLIQTKSKVILLEKNKLRRGRKSKKIYKKRKTLPGQQFGKLKIEAKSQFQEQKQEDIKIQLQEYEDGDQYIKQPLKCQKLYYQESSENQKCKIEEPQNFKLQRDKNSANLQIDTPKKKKNIDFNLEKSPAKDSTMFSRSNRDKFLIGSNEKARKIKTNSESDSNEKNEENYRKTFSYQRNLFREQLMADEDKGFKITPKERLFE